MVFETEINGLKIKAQYYDKDVKNLFIPLLESLTDLQKKLGKRTIVFLAAPPAAGKSTLAAFLEYLSEKTDGVTKITSLGIDGFHMSRKYLDENTAIIDGREICLADIKGAPQTFDTGKFREHLEKLRSGEKLFWPGYDRVIHETKENAREVSGDIILVEGNYLLLDEAGWDSLSVYADCTINMIADETMLYNRLVERKMIGGKSKTEAEEFVKKSDMRNVKLCLEKTKVADLNLFSKDDGSYLVLV